MSLISADITPDTGELSEFLESQNQAHHTIAAAVRTNPGLPGC
jgi:hypothetical protein